VTQELAWQSGRRHRFRLRVETPYESDRGAAARRPRNQSRLPLPGRKPGCTPRNGIHDDCRRFRRGDFIPRFPIRTPRQAFRDWGGARVSIVLLTSALFALGHYSNQGLPGVEQAMITGLVFGTIFSITGRIWMVMCAHAAFDLAAVAIIYWNLEAIVAHLVFK